MTMIPQNKQLRGILGGCAALAAVMAGPILVDASAQAAPQASCISGGVCLTSTGNSTITVPVTTTETTTVPFTTTETTSVPFTTTVTAPVTTTETTTQPVTTTETTTQPVTTTVPVTTTETTTQPVTTTTTTTTFTTTTTTTTNEADVVGGVRHGARTDGPDTTSTSTGQCIPPGRTTSLAANQVETCGPSHGHVAVYATAPGLYTTIFDNDNAYYVSAGIFAPQFRFGILVGCYYVPDNSSVTAPGQTSTVTTGVLANAVAFGLRGSEVSRPILVPREACAAR